MIRFVTISNERHHNPNSEKLMDLIRKTNKTVDCVIERAADSMVFRRTIDEGYHSIALIDEYTHGGREYRLVLPTHQHARSLPEWCKQANFIVVLSRSGRHLERAASQLLAIFEPTRMRKMSENGMLPWGPQRKTRSSVVRPSVTVFRPGLRDFAPRASG
jgi:hypothetical protein